MQFGLEAVGYAASLLVAASLMMSNIRRLRWVNLAGAIAFTAYGALVGAWPVFAVNLFVAGVDVYHLRRLARRNDFFTLLPVAPGDAFMRKFVTFHAADIRRFFPELDLDGLDGVHSIFVLRNLLPVGLFCYRPREDGDIEIRLDYVIPEYRDHRNADFLYRILNERFAAQGHRAFVVETGVATHARYLEHEGFERDAAGERVYRKRII